jgi:hypothetical protein
VTEKSLIASVRMALSAVAIIRRHTPSPPHSHLVPEYDFGSLQPCIEMETREEHFRTQNFANSLRPHARIFLSAPTNKNRAYRISFENLLRSIEPVKIAFRWRILNDMTLVRNELRIKASWYTDISIFSVAIEARIWLYVGLCCDAGRLDSVTVPAVASHRSFPTRMN